MNTQIGSNTHHQNYFKKMSVYLFFSIVFHLCFLFIMTKIQLNSGVSPYLPQTRPIRIDFVKPEETRKKLVEVAEPTEEKPESTENIAEFNAVASGPEKMKGDIPGPPLPEESNIEKVGSENKQMQVANVNPPTKKEPIKKQKTTPEKRESPVLDKPESEKTKSELAKQELERKEQEMMIAKEEPKDISQPDYLSNALQKHQGKIYNQVKREGILGFEALQDQLAPYLREIQRKVEKYWLHYLLTRYSGTKPTEVVIDCEINSEGKIVRIDIIGKPDDPLFAGICKQALQVSAPFSPFPFKVPDIYRNKNLQIRWTFSFM